MGTVHQKKQAESAKLKERVRALRAKGLLLDAIAARVGVTKQRVSQILIKQAQ